MEMHEDQQLWQRFQCGELEAFSKLFLQYHPMLLNYGLQLCQDEELAEECIQDLFSYIYEKRDRLGEVSYIRSYLFASFRRRIMRMRQRSSKTFPISSFADHFMGFQLPREHSLIHQEINEARQSQLSEMLNTLPLRQREAIFLKYYNGLDAAEMAQVMGISHQGVLNILYKALKNMRKLANYTNAFGTA